MTIGNQFKCGQITSPDGNAHQFPVVANIGGLRIKALKANAGVIVLGNDNTVTVAGATGGYPLDPGEAIDAELLNLQDVWYIAATPGDKIAWAVVGGGAS